MNQEQLKQLTEQIGLIWTEWSSLKRQEILKEKLYKYDYQKSSKIVLELSEWHSKAPSIADIVQALKKAETQQNEEYRVCRTCNNDGWIFVDNKGAGTVKKCGCGLGELKPNRLPGFTSDGSKVATSEQKRQAVIKGFIKFKPEAKKEEIELHLKKFALKPELDSEDYKLINSLQPF